MLDNAKKKNIDDCRDVLVGKVPDPKSQIEQITFALIYKLYAIFVITLSRNSMLTNCLKKLNKNVVLWCNFCIFAMLRKWKKLEQLLPTKIISKNFF